MLNSLELLILRPSFLDMSQLSTLLMMETVPLVGRGCVCCKTLHVAGSPHIED